MAQAPAASEEEKDSIIEQVLSDPSLFTESAEASKYQCGICLQICNNPVETGCKSGHIFCSLCFSQWFKTYRRQQIRSFEEKLNDDDIDAVMPPINHGICPLDRQKCSKNGIKSYFANRQIMQLKIKCLYHNNGNGCSWNGTVIEITSHLLKDCLYFAKECDYCNEKICQNEMAKHLKKHIEIMNIERKKMQNLINFGIKWNDQSIEQIQRLRRHQMDAFIVKFAKNQNNNIFLFDACFQYVKSMLKNRFAVTEIELKKRFVMLIEWEYIDKLERNENGHWQYKYQH